MITGCDTGFGHDLAKSLHRLGFTVFAGCLNDCSDGALALKKLDAVTNNLHVIQMDVTNQEQVDAARDYVQRNLPSDVRLWGLVNNAGFSYRAFIEWLPIENYEKVLSIKLHENSHSNLEAIYYTRVACRREFVGRRSCDEIVSSAHPQRSGPSRECSLHLWPPSIHVLEFILHH